MQKYPKLKKHKITQIQKYTNYNKKQQKYKYPKIHIFKNTNTIQKYK